MATDEFLKDAEAVTALSQQIGLYDDGTGATDNDKLLVDLESARNEIWAGIKQYAVFNTTTKDFDYSLIENTRSENLLKGFCLALFRYYAYLNSQQATIPQTVLEEAMRVRKLIETGKIILPDILLKKSAGEEPLGSIQVYKNEVKFNQATVRDY